MGIHGIREAARLKEKTVCVSAFLEAFYPDEEEEFLIKPKAPSGTPKSYTYCFDFRTTRRKILTSLSYVDDDLFATNVRHDLYFMVNAGDESYKGITRFNAFFIKAGWMSLEEQGRRFDEAPILPSIRVQTRKSIHGYWLIDGECNETSWCEVQRSLRSFFREFRSDSEIQCPSCCMRLPWSDQLRYDKITRVVSRYMARAVTFEPSRRHGIKEMYAAFFKSGR